MRLPFVRILVAGPSMVPTLRAGDAVVVRRGARVRSGDVVLGRFRDGPERLVVKRAVRPHDGGWWVEGDNPYASDDSRRYGAATVEGRVVWRYRPLWRYRSRRRPPAPSG
jgi:phage repressor protein C with HTH and peptisase S24 domain